MSSNQSIDQALTRTQRHLFYRFMGILLVCLTLIEMVVGALFFYDLYRAERKILHSLSAEYQRILRFESDEKLIHVLKANPQRLTENNIAAMATQISSDKPASYIAGDNQLPVELVLTEYLLGEQNWLNAFIVKPYMTLKMEGDKQIFWLVLDNRARYAVATRQWMMTFMAFCVLVLFTAVFIHRLIQNTMSPLATLGNQLDKLSHHALDSFSEQDEIEPPRNGTFSRTDAMQQDGLVAINQSVYQAVSRLHQVIATMDTTVDAIAHDLRTPLSRIRLAAEGALVSPLKGAEKQNLQEHALSDCAEYAVQAGNMLTALMKLNDELAGKRIVRLAPTEVKMALERVASWFEDIAEEKGIELHCTCSPGIIILSDADKLTQVLVNLVDNALKYTPPGGSVRLSASTIAPSLPPVEHHAVNQPEKTTQLVINVTDTGIGIAPEHQDLVFKRLYRVDSSRSNSEGYGLGLALASAMVTNLGGILTVESVPQQGSTFTIRLNVDESETQSNCH